MTYTDELGDEHKAYGFFVLALRHDPSDATPPYPRTSAGAMDPTGPLHWLNFWPRKDPDYCALSDSARGRRRPSGGILGQLRRECERRRQYSVVELKSEFVESLRFEHLN